MNYHLVLQCLFLLLYNRAQYQLGCKKALVCPTFKKGDQKNAAYYRPVSLTSVCSKIMEHVICSNIMFHLKNHTILTHQQFGGYSVELHAAFTNIA